MDIKKVSLKEKVSQKRSEIDPDFPLYDIHNHLDIHVTLEMSKTLNVKNVKNVK